MKIILEFPDVPIQFVELSAHVVPVRNDGSFCFGFAHGFDRVVCFSDLLPGDSVNAKIEE